jgi:hypothetical protein
MQASVFAPGLFSPGKSKKNPIRKDPAGIYLLISWQWRFP